MQEGLLGTILDNLQDGVCLLDKDGNFLYVNRTVISMRNISRSEYRKQNVHDLVSDSIIDVSIFEEVLKSRTIVEMIQQFNPPGKKSVKRLVTGIPVFGELGEVENVITIVQDVEGIEKKYESLKKKKKVISSENYLKKSENDSFITVSPKMKELIGVAGNVAKLDATILINGESGVGKEVFMRFIHQNSNRSKQPLIEVNCGAFPESLLEAELFGYEEGSFTGALHTGKVGLVEAADGGTLFLDEINSMPLSLQSKLLRMIEKKSIKRIGAVKEKNVDFRLIAATNEDLAKLVEKGLFRADLYYRLNVIPVLIPPLRERKEDIIPLVNYYVEYFGEKYGIAKTFSRSVLRNLSSYDWKGNVRELKNFVERLMVMTPPEVTVINRIPKGLLQWSNESDTAPARVAKRELDKETVQKALEACGGHRQKTADYLGISRRTLQYRLKEYGLS